MNYQREELIIPIIIVALTLFYFFVKTRSRQFEFIKNTWFKSPTKINKIRFILKMIGLALLMISLLDFRGAEEKIESSIPDQKTIIIIDSSASMLAEDVRPNRYQKSILMARHFIKKAFGHRLAVVLFSDTQKRLVPFTDDLDLLDARVAGLGDVKNYDGGSNVTQAIRESMGYFRVEKGAGRDVGGNILVFTDSEGHDDGIELKLPERVSLAIVGVGTLKGARIPKRDRYNTFRGYKKYEGKEVYTKLNESWLKSLSGKVKTYKYWIANSYSIPTEEVLSFFNKSFDDKINKGSATVKPVKAHFLILPGLVCLIISFFLYPLRAFACLFLVFSFTAPFVSKPLLAQEEAEEEIVLREETKMLIDSHRAGDLSKENKVRLAEELLRDGDFVRSNMLYDELGTGLDYKARNNHAVALLKGKKPAKALGKFSEIQYEVRDRSDVSEQFKK
jgi:Ca-activated chloride channel family protein